MVDRDNSVGIATRYGPDCVGIKSRWGEICPILPDRTWGPPSLLYNGYRVISPAVKRLGCGADHPLPCSVEFKERGELYLYSPSGTSWQVMG